MSSWSMDLLKVSLIGDKKEIVEILNVIMKNRGIFNFLTIDDTFDKMMEVIRTLNSSHLKREDFYERPYYHRLDTDERIQFPLYFSLYVQTTSDVAFDIKKKYK